MTRPRSPNPEEDEMTDEDDETNCPCEDPEAPRGLLSSHRGGVDETWGRFADVTISRCRRCGQHWVKYQLEYEAFSRSGRWARGKIDADLAATIAVEEVAEHINALPAYIAGGSYFGSTGQIRRGRMPWGIMGYDREDRELMVPRRVTAAEEPGDR